jgi:hypothetical protein
MSIRGKIHHYLHSFTIIFFMLIVGGWCCLAASPSFAATDTVPCAANPESRQLDFWLGEWNVTYPGMPHSSSSKVVLDLDQCAVAETWDGGKGHTGKNMFAYSSDDKRWHGMFVDNQGRVHVFEGKVADGYAEFSGPSRSPDGQAVLNRIKVVRQGVNKVEQSWEKSKDNGLSWAVEFRGEYSRKNP